MPRKFNHGKAYKNSKGRTFSKGCAISRDLRALIIYEIVRNDGDRNTDFFLGKFSDVANAFKVRKTVITELHMATSTYRIWH